MFTNSHNNTLSHIRSDICRATMAMRRRKTFQSTLPRGERPDNHKFSKFIGMFQSTLPRGERRRSCAHPSRLPSRFQSTLPRGERPSVGGSISPSGGFNPRSHVGSDVGCPRLGRVCRLFQSTLPRRERLFQGMAAHTHGLFQSTLPCGERLCVFARFVDELVFQSTLPCGERLCLRSSLFKF